MIEVHRNPDHRGRARRRPRLVAIFSYRYDAHLVPDLIENIRPLVNGWISYDDRGASGLFSSEVERRRALLAAARETGARWILGVDPDERFETGLASYLPLFLAASGPTIWTFDLRELYTPTAYRCDGLWGAKRQGRLFSVPRGDADGETPALHGGWAPDSERYRTRHTGFALYHLKMIDPARRRARRDLYGVLDPARAMQRAGYDYLVDETDAAFREIPPGRGYLPPHREDHALWMPDVETATPGADPPEVMLDRADRLRAEGRPHRSVEILGDVAGRIAADAPLQTRLAALAIAAGAFDLARRAADKALACDPGDAAAAQLARAADLLRRSGVVAQAPPAEAIAWPWNPLRHDLLAVGRGEDRCLATPFLDAPVRVRRGREAPTEPAAIAVVVIALGAPSTLRAAVASVLENAEPCEVVVVNTGGGGAGAVLGAACDRITLIEVEKPCFAGMARNLGVLASRAGIVGFLASDCTAAEGWLERRLEAHRTGASCVAGAVVHDVAGSAVGHAHHHVLFSSRMPTTPPARARRYSLSYERRLFDACGLFDPGLRVGEDTDFNRALEAAGHKPVWRPDVVTVHRGEPSLPRALRDMFGRGERSGRTGPLVPPAQLREAGWWQRWRRLATAVREGARERSLAASISLALSATRPRPAAMIVEALAAAYQLGVLKATVAGMRADDLTQRARSALEGGDPATAERHARRAWSLRPDARRAHLLWSVLAARGVPDADAVATFERALGQMSLDAGTMDVYVGALKSVGNLGAARNVAERSLAFHPTARRFVEVAELRVAAGDQAGAEAACRSAAQMSPPPPLVRRLGRTMRRLGLREEIVDLAARAVMVAPRQPELADRLETFLARRSAKGRRRPKVAISVAAGAEKSDTDL